MKKLLSVISSLSIVSTSASAIVACNSDPLPIAGNDPNSIGDKIPDTETTEDYYKWLGDQNVGDFDPDRAQELVVDSEKKVVINNVNSTLVATKLNEQSWVNAGNLYDSICTNILRNIYGINVINQVGDYTHFNIFFLGLSVEDLISPEQWIENDYGDRVSSGLYRVQATQSSPNITGSFQFELSYHDDQD
ncbi:putative lipoprotein [Spiroplasma clarkii]|uniref:Lipoprotein n=1 Tax=Spiroplasma clarkii TaxID=2139 RepID=A0A1Y0L1G8_9MOLU|nr:lipoprotein [Spiroplasma clarkii]ARU91539.1 putative lipoprotein [Spiroplasma clarkii]ATX70945.1 hypothetical protein SCLAR_v1c06260 [Spiroplasma clarkii]